jgi:DNA-binding MurR/RpiR family transcriptional regulator
LTNVSILIGGTIAGSTTVCPTTNSTVLSLNGQIGNIIRWESSLDNFATSVTNIVSLAKQNKLNVICITSNPKSIVAKNSSSLILLNCQTKESNNLQRLSLQPMTTIFEQSLYLTLDALVMVLMNKMNETHYTMLERHNNLE